MANETVSPPPVMVVPDISIEMGHVAEPAPQPAQASTVLHHRAEPEIHIVIDEAEPAPRSPVALPRQVVGPVHLPVANLSTQIDSCVLSNPPWGHIMLLAFQQFFLSVMASTIIATQVVSMMDGTDGDTVRMIQLLLLMSGLTTLLQTWLGTRMPTVMGPSLDFMIAIAWTVKDLNYPGFDTNPKRFSHTVRALQGDLIMSFILPIMIGYTRFWGWLTRYINPLVVVSLSSACGLGLLHIAFPMLQRCFGVGLPALLFLLGCQYMKRVNALARSVFGKYTVMISLGLSWVFAAFLTASGVYDHVSATTRHHCRTDSSYLISAAPWVKIPYLFQYGLPIFRASSVFGMMGPALVSVIQSTGTLYCASRFAGATIPPSDVISRCIGLQGVGQLLSGMFGTPVSTTISPGFLAYILLKRKLFSTTLAKSLAFQFKSYDQTNPALLSLEENVGLVGLTAIGSRRVIQVSAALMLFFSIFGKFVAVLASVPLSVYGPLYGILLGIVAACGLSFTQFVNTNSLRNMFVLGVSFLLAISLPQYFAISDGSSPVKTDAGWFNIVVNTILASSPAVALIVSSVLDNTLEPQSLYDRGTHWFTQFHVGDHGNREFYSLPPLLSGWFHSG